MKKLGLILITLCFAACSKDDKPEEVGFTETKLIWQGASAEQIEALIQGLTPPLQMAVIDDNQAMVYYKATVEQTMKHFEALADRPYGLMIAPPTRLGGELPKTPQTQQIKQVEWIAKPQPIEAMGVSKSELLNYLKQLEADASKPEKLRGLTYTIQSSNEVIALSELVDHRVISIQRPLIIGID